ncbi:Uncharacterised protein [Mycobacteroides abscessus subsp. abscessus]|nr:Uncharacterised protein [Mycobacteroides abscessus subsp. abscessus]
MQIVHPRLRPNISGGVGQDAVAVLVYSESAGPTALSVDHHPAAAGQQQMIDVGAAETERGQPSALHIFKSGEVVENVHGVGAPEQPAFNRIGDTALKKRAAPRTRLIAVYRCQI